MVKLLINTFLILLFILPFPFISFSQEIYEYERMWPVLEQPWYFYFPEGIAADSSGNIYVADTYNHRIQKFTSNGQFIGKWGGGEDSKFAWPRGVAVDSSGNVYVADTLQNRIQKFTSDGQFITKWGSRGSGDGQFEYVISIAIDSRGNVYVADPWNHRIQKFTPKGQFITKFGSEGSEDGQFSSPGYVAFDSSDNVYVADAGNSRIQKFSSDGQFITKWGSYGSGDGQFWGPYGITIEKNGNVYVADPWNHRIQKFTSNGQFITKWGSYGSGDGQFNNLYGITVDNNGNVYVPDRDNNRIQKFTSNGQFISKWGYCGNEDGQFNFPFLSHVGITVDNSGNVYVNDAGNGRIQKFSSDTKFIAKWATYCTAHRITVDSSGNVYVSDMYNNRIQKFNSNGQVIAGWGSEGSGDGQFSKPSGIAVDTTGSVYVVDTGNNRIQKFTSNGQFVTKWGSQGSENGKFGWSSSASLVYGSAAAVDSIGNVYVADFENYRIQKFTSNGQFVTKWDNGDFPWDITVDSRGNVYVANWSYSYCIQKFTSDGQFIAKWGNYGSNAGELNEARGIAVGSDGRVFVADGYNNRIQVFSKVTKPFNNKAIIIAGGGPYLDNRGIRVKNNLWPATQTNTNFAYRTLTYQGFSNKTIYYLSSDINLDLNDDGIPDVDAEPTNNNLQYALTEWAKDADNVVIYLVGHGGNGTFRINETDLLKTEDLNLWLNTLQQTMQGTVVLIYDACYSGSFLSKLIPPGGKQRILISGSAEDEVAWFMNNGMVSFSYLFWSRIFYGDRIFKAFSGTQKSMGDPQRGIRNQNPQLDDNGNGKGNEEGDGAFSTNYSLGKGIVPVNMNTNMFSIVSASSDQTLRGETSATIFVDNIENLNGVTGVWAIVIPPDFKGTSTDPVTDLPTFDLTWNEQNRRYEGTYDGFTVVGTYTVMVYAMNKEIAVSLPKAILIKQTGGKSNRCDFNGDGKTDILWRNKSTGQNIVWYMNDATYSGYAELMQVTDTNWEIVGTGDFNGDGKTDILWRNKSTGQNVVWYMNGTTYNSYSELMQVPDTNWQIVGTGDFNGDGKTDILWRNKSTGQNIVWFMNGTAYTSYAELMQVTDTNWLIVGTGDFNSDGKVDILWRNKTTGQNVVWYMNGANYSNYAEIMQVPDTNWEIVGTGDFNGDGKTDILWRNKSTGQNIIWLMNGSTYSSYAELMQVPDPNWEIVGPK